MGHLIPGIQIFQNLALEGQGHSWRSHIGSNILSTSILFVPCPIHWPTGWKLRVSHWLITLPIYLPYTVAQGQFHCAPNIISNSHPFHSKWVKPPIPELQQFQYFRFMGELKVWSHNVSLTFYRLTSLSFHVNRPFHSWDTTFSKFNPQNPRSRSWKRWTLKITTWVQHSVDSHPFRSMWIGHPIHKIRLFQNLTLKIQGRGHGWGESWKSQHGSNILSTHIPFIPCQPAIPFLRYDFFKIWPWKSKVKVMV